MRRGAGLCRAQPRGYLRVPLPPPPSPPPPWGTRLRMVGRQVGVWAPVDSIPNWGGRSYARPGLGATYDTHATNPKRTLAKQPNAVETVQNIFFIVPIDQFSVRATTCY